MFKNMHPIDIFRQVDTQFYTEPWLAWEPEVLADTLEIPDEDFDKLSAVQAVGANSNMALDNAVAFENVVLAFNNNYCNPDLVQFPFIEEIMYAIPQILDIIKAVHGESVDIEFAGEVPGYVAAVAKERGWLVLPERISFAQETLFSLTGYTEESPKFKEHKEILAKAFKLRDNPEDLEDPFAKKVVGAYLYDPTNA